MCLKIKPDVILPQDSDIVVESFKSGFSPPAEFPFEDFSQNIQRTGSDSTIGTPKNEGGKPDPKHAIGRTKNKLWLFGKKPKVRFRHTFHCHFLNFFLF